jgi:glutathione S-transferase
MGLQLVIGNKNYSSWSFRPWLAMKVARIPFEETVIPLDTPDFKSRITALSGAGKVPVLIDGDTCVWESLAILEHLAEKFPEAGLWPQDAQARAHARAISAEMHAGFQPLRRQLPMNMRRPVKPQRLEADAETDVQRIEAIWSHCRARFGQGGGPFLHGAFGAADAMMRRSSRAFTPMGWESAPSRANTCARSRPCRPGASGARRGGASPGSCHTMRSTGRRRRGSKMRSPRRAAPHLK